LRFRKTGGRIRVYFRFTRPDGKRDEMPIGWYDEGGRDGWSLTRVRDEAAKIREQYQSGSGDVRADQAAAQAALDAQNRAQEAEREEAARKAREREQYTLGALCSAYVRLLKSRGKAKSARDTASCFKVHVPTETAGLPANEITPHQVAAMVRNALEAGKERTAGVLRSYLRAAYGAAIRAPFDAALPADLIPFHVESNPVDAVPAIAVQAGNRTLSRDELTAYLGTLGDGIIDRALRLALLAGGQRIAQLLRARVADWDDSEGVLRLWDGKGKRKDAREHLLPLGPQGADLAQALVQRARERADPEDLNPSLFLSLGGAIMNYTSASKRVADPRNGERWLLWRIICTGSRLRRAATWSVWGEGRHERMGWARPPGADDARRTDCLVSRSPEKIRRAARLSRGRP
jgi:integrase